MPKTYEIKRDVHGNYYVDDMDEHGNGNIVDVTKMVRAGFSPEKTIDMAFSDTPQDKVTGENVSREKALEVDTPRILEDTYAKTGVRPDQVFEDAKNNPEVAADISNGKIPSAYDHLRTLTPAEEGLESEGAGETVTKQPIKPSEPNPNLSGEGASTSINPLAKIFNPAGMSDSARDMATSLRQGRGPETQDVAKIQDNLQQYGGDIKALSDADRLKLIDYMENRTKGAENPLPQIQEAADAIRDIYAQYAVKIQEAFPDTGDIND